jgi:hypothetical protein
MQLSEIRNEVSSFVNDSAFTADIIDGYINDVYKQVVAACLVPELKGVDTVSTTANAYVSLSNVSGGFSGSLSRVYKSTGVSLKIYEKLEDLMDFSGGLMSEAGDILAVALEGSVLWYSKIPETAEVLTVLYYRNPELLFGDVDIPVMIPDFLHRDILVNGAISIAFNIIEGGLEGVKVVSTSRAAQKNNGVMRFKEWLSKTRRHYIAPQLPF